MKSFDLSEIQAEIQSKGEARREWIAMFSDSGKMVGRCCDAGHKPGDARCNVPYQSRKQVSLRDYRLRYFLRSLGRITREEY